MDPRDCGIVPAFKAQHTIAELEMQNIFFRATRKFRVLEPFTGKAFKAAPFSGTADP
jgi:hypothetical protein